MSKRTNHPITLSFEPVRVGDPKLMTGLSQKAGIYILGVMEPKRTDVFCPLYVGKILGSLGANITKHYHGKRRGFFNGNTIVDVHKDFKHIYADIATLYTPTKPTKNNRRPRFTAIHASNDTVLWFNSPDFYNTILTKGVYQSNHPVKDNCEAPYEMDGPNGHWAKMQKFAINDPNLLADIRWMQSRFTRALKHMREYFAFSYAEVSHHDMAKAYPHIGASKRGFLEQEEFATKSELLNRGIRTHSKAVGSINPLIKVNFGSVGCIYP